MRPERQAGAPPPPAPADDELGPRSGGSLAFWSPVPEQLVDPRGLELPFLGRHEALGGRQHRRDRAAVVHREWLVELRVYADGIVHAEHEACREIVDLARAVEH